VVEPNLPGALLSATIALLIFVFYIRIHEARRRVRVLQVLFVTVCGFVVSSAGWAQTPCTPSGREIPLQNTLASAGFFANLRNASYSVRAQTDRLLKDARAEAQVLKTNEGGCKRACPNPVVAVLFSSTPQKYLLDHEEASQCQTLLERTSKAPIVYENRRFQSDDQAREWYEDLTQGNGVDGEDLYRRCPGACSPAYSSQVYRDGDEFVVSTSIVCGHARDKNDDQYTLSTKMRWICP
jgi:hypothetical protein